MSATTARARLLDTVRSDVLDRHHVTVTDARMVTPRTRRLRLAGDELHGMPTAPVCTFVLAFGATSGRHYTVRHAHPASDASPPSFDVDVLLHGPGPGADWAREAAPGDDVVVYGPKNREMKVDPGAEHAVIVGDETSLSAADALLAGLPSTCPAWLLLQTESAADELPLRLRPQDTCTWLRREQNSLFGILADATLPTGRGAAYVTGELGLVRAVRDHLRRDRGWDRRQVHTKPHWAPGRTGL